MNQLAHELTCTTAMGRCQGHFCELTNAVGTGAAILASMAKRYGQHCPVAQSLDVVGDRWTLLIVRDLLRGPARFQDLRAQLSGIPPKLLADRLRRMERQGLVARTLYSKRPPRASYTLTDRGRGLGLVVGALAIWGRPFVGPRSGPRHATCGHPIELQHYCPRCEEHVTPATVNVPVAAARRPRASGRAPRRPGDPTANRP